MSVRSLSSRTFTRSVLVFLTGLGQPDLDPLYIIALNHNRPPESYKSERKREMESSKGRMRE